MRRTETYEFNDNEIHVLAEALAMYSAYMDETVLPDLMGDESDKDTIMREANAARTMALDFIEADRDKRWAELSTDFHEMHGRPPDMNDISAHDWRENDSN